MKRICSALLVAGFLVTGCGAEEGTEGGSCIGGSSCNEALSCFKDTCIADQSLKAGDNCTQDRQCKSDDCQSTCQ